MLYKKVKYQPTSINVNNSYEAESLEEKVFRILNNKEPIKDSAPMIYTERRDGVKAEYNIRTDRFEIALDAMDAVNRSKLTKRLNRLKMEEDAKKGKDNISGAEPIQATDNQ